MTLRHELDDAINKIESSVALNRKTVELTPHRWEQMLRILKFYRLKWDEFDNDQIWDGDQKDPNSPYFHRFP